MKKIFAISTLCNSGFRIEVCQGVYARKKSWIERSEDIVESRRETVKGAGWWSVGSSRSAWFGCGDVEF